MVYKFSKEEQELAEDLMRMRKKAKLSREDVAKHIGVTQQSIFKYETGKNRIRFHVGLMLLELYKQHTNIEPVGEVLKSKNALELDVIKARNSLVLQKLKNTQTMLAEGMALLQTCGDPGYPHGMNDGDKPKSEPAT